MCFYVDEYAEVWRESTPKARKEYKCDECGGAILAGETYRCIFTIFESQPDTFRECQKCQAVRAAIAKIEHARGCEGQEAIAPMGGLAEAISDDSPDHYGLMRYDEDADEYAVSRAASHLFKTFPVLIGEMA
jgi:hypothetical protein